MAQYGQYDPNNTENSSTMFDFQEAPLTSAKLNLWNGNLVTVFEWLHKVCVSLFAKASPAVITSGGDESLTVQPADSPDMTVKVKEGWAVLDGYLAGLASQQVLPSGGSFTAPAVNPRIDLVVLSSLGQLETVQGEEAAAPSTPSASAGSMTLAQIYHRVGATQIKSSDDSVNSYIVDVRPRMLLGEAHYHGSDRAPSESPDGSRTDFSTSAVFRADALDVFVNGVLQQKDVDYIEDSDRQGYTFVTAPQAHYRIQHRYIVEYESA